MSEFIQRSAACVQHGAATRTGVTIDSVAARDSAHNHGSPPSGADIAVAMSEFIQRSTTLRTKRHKAAMVPPQRRTVMVPPRHGTVHCVLPLGMAHTPLVFDSRIERLRHTCPRAQYDNPMQAEALLQHGHTGD